ncbi:MAG: hypothetical protein PHP57_04515 [Sideroxydans sp.]|nr:hypothetical protein [Sideroxydans sp.]
MSAPQTDAAEAMFHQLQRQFPNLRMTVNRPATHYLVDLLIDRQSGLVFDVYLYLENNDELHLVAGDHHYEWFPCTDPSLVEECFTATCGLLNGEYRILECRRSTDIVRGELQRQTVTDPEKWETTLHSISAGFSFRLWNEKTCDILQNIQPPNQSVEGDDS